MQWVVTGGAAQGSIKGPGLYNSFLGVDMPDESRLVGYADDVAARDVEQIRMKLNQIVRRVRSMGGRWSTHCCWHWSSLTFCP